MSVLLRYWSHRHSLNRLKVRFLDRDGLKSYGQLETVLLSGNVDHTKQYLELSAADLELELAMSLSKYAVTKVSDATEIFQKSERFSHKLNVCFDCCRSVLLLQQRPKEVSVFSVAS